MGRVKWQDWMDRVVLERYAGEENAVLCRELGVGIRTLERHAAALGLRKSEEHMRRGQAKAVKGALKRCAELRKRGEKRKLSRAGGRPFEKGHRFSGEVEERRVRSIRFAKSLKSGIFAAVELRKLNRKELDALFEERKRLLIEVRDEIDRRERGSRAGVDVEWTEYVEQD